MAKGAATVSALAELHELVASVMKAQLSDTAVYVDEETNEEKQVFTASPALITVITRFLNDNSVTCQEDSELITGLRDELANKAKGRRLASVARIAPEAANG